MRNLKKLIHKFLEYWNIWGSLIISLFWAWWNRFCETTMEKTTTFLTMTLMFVGLMTFIKSRLKHEKIKKQKDDESNFGEKLVEGSKSYKAINIAINPEQEFSKLEKFVAFIIKKGKWLMKKIGTFFKWCAKYWQQLLGYIGSLGTLVIYVYLLIQDEFTFILQYLPEGDGWRIGVKVAFGVVALLITILIIRNQSVWKGIGTLEQAINQNVNTVEEIKTKLSPTALARAKELLKTYKENLKKIETTIKNLTNKKAEIEEQIKSIKELQQADVEIDQAYYNDLLQQKNNNDGELSKAQLDKLAIQEKINKVEKVL